MHDEHTDPHALTRRQMLSAGGALGALATLPATLPAARAAPAAATPEAQLMQVFEVHTTPPGPACPFPGVAKGLQFPRLNRAGSGDRFRWKMPWDGPDPATGEVGWGAGRGVTNR